MSAAIAPVKHNHVVGHVLAPIFNVYSLYRINKEAIRCMRLKLIPLVELEKFLR